MSAAPPPDDGLSARMRAFAAALRGPGAIRSDTVEGAFATVARHRCVERFWDEGNWVEVSQEFVPPAAVLDAVYSDRPLVTQLSGEGVPSSSSSQPGLVARMLEELRLSPGLRVLEVGAGTGWNAALMATQTGAPVVSVDAGAEAAAGAARSLERLAAAGLAAAGLVTVVHGDGWAGHPDGAPYDRVVVTCGCAGASPRWLEQLTPGGFALVPMSMGGTDPVVRVRAGDPPTAEGVCWAGFMTAGGPLGAPVGGLARPRPLPVLDEQPLSGEARFGPPLDWDTYTALWFGCAAADGRVAAVAMPPRIDPELGLCALVDPDRGTAWLQMDGMVRSVGDPGVLDQALALAAMWERAGRPGIGAWRCGLAPAGDPAAPVLIPDGAGWSLDSGHHESMG
jgi:protein-L-isoaspartate(D-aspartate) O-methyltransferase